MDNISPGTAIETNGEFALTQTKHAPIVQIKGDLDGGTVTLGIVDPDGDFAPLLDLTGNAITTTVAGAIRVPTNEKIAVKLAGATEPDFVVNLI
jgi:hypothetical protein